MLEYLEGRTPKDFGFDPKQFPEYRKDKFGHEVQLEAIEFAMGCERRIAAAAIPTGVGKSLIAMSVARGLGVRTVVLTETKALQQQYLKEFGRYGLVEIKGRGNYECQDHQGVDCKIGGMMGCLCVQGGGCPYEDAKRRARNSDLVVVNYAYWMTVNDKSTGLERTDKEAEWKGENPVELLVLDEGHSAPELLSGYLAVRIYEREIERWVEPKKVWEKREEWLRIADEAVLDLDADMEVVQDRIREAKRNPDREDVKELHRLELLKGKFERIRTIEDDWVIERRDGTRYGRMWAFDVIWPGRYAERYLFCGVPRVMVMSATLRPKTMGLLGVGKEGMEFKEWDRVFPANRHPIYSVPAVVNGKQVRVDRRTTDVEMKAWVEQIDRIIDERLDRKGIVHSVSYDRQKYLFDNSRHSDVMLGNTGDPDSEGAVEIAEIFRKADPPCVLVSPSFGTGWDFPMQQCEYVIVCKVPFKPNQGKVQKAREERDKQYGSYMAMQEMVQGCGRGMRSEKDQCEVFIVDGHLGWFVGQNKGLAPGWFVNAIRRVGEVPRALKKL